MQGLLHTAALARWLPFALFMGFLILRGHWPEAGVAGITAPWVYGLGVVAVTAALVWGWKHYGELRRATTPSLTWREVLLSVLVGVVVFQLWIHLDEPWMMIGEPTASFHPVDAEGRLMWDLIVVRFVGAALLVPVMEELFWRGFLMRWIDDPDFEKVNPKAVSLRAVLLSTAAFVTVHTLWLGAIVAGLAYAWLYRRTGKLWAPIVAHAVTNGVLGVWVVVLGQWSFW